MCARKSAVLSTSLQLLVAASTLASAHRPQPRDSKTWQQQATLYGDAECVPYDFPPVSNIVHTYPQIWEIADLSNPSIDPEVVALFKKINSSIPNIPPKGTPNGVWNGGYNGGQDPDCWWTYTGCDKPKDQSLPADLTQCNEPRTWGYTLDDGPNCTHNAFYDYLKSQNQKATLFYIGSNVLDWPLEAQRGLADGHEIMAHTWSHNYMTGLTNEQAFAELYFSKKAIKDVVGVTVRGWRPPFGDVDDRIRYIANALDMQTVLWNEDTDDWRWVNVGIPAIEQNYEDIIGNVSAKYSRSGTIVLSHELNNETMALSQQFLPQIGKAYTGGVMPIAVCTNNTAPYLETEGYTYPNYEQWVSGTTSVSLAAPTAAGKGHVLQFASNSTSSSAVPSSTSGNGSSSSSAVATGSGKPTSSSSASRTDRSASAANQSEPSSSATKAADHHNSAPGLKTNFGTNVVALIIGALAVVLF
ncbi:hypothetical protein OIV83_005658 [Microbotryomycetes sp. JL201]|nr:hypothetical protein OIV83_005658 [Microbotryomycetes sp. JL201]